MYVFHAAVIYFKKLVSSVLAAENDFITEFELVVHGAVHVNEVCQQFFFLLLIVDNQQRNHSGLFPKLHCKFVSSHLCRSV